MPKFYPQKEQAAKETNIPLPPTSMVYNPVQGFRHTCAPSSPTAAGAELTHSFSKSTGHNQCRINYCVRALVKSIKIRAQIWKLQ